MTNHEKAVAAWGDPPPDWIEKLAVACDTHGLRKAAAELSLSPALVSLAIRNCHHASLDYIKERVEDFLGTPIVPCPVLGLITREGCRDNQKKPFSSINPIEVQLFRACRGGCIHSKIKKEKRHDR